MNYTERNTDHPLYWAYLSSFKGKGVTLRKNKTSTEKLKQIFSEDLTYHDQRYAGRKNEKSFPCITADI